MKLTREVVDELVGKMDTARRSNFTDSRTGEYYPNPVGVELYGYLIGSGDVVKRVEWIPLDFCEVTRVRRRDATNAGFEDRVFSELKPGEDLLGYVHKHIWPALNEEIPRLPGGPFPEKDLLTPSHADLLGAVIPGETELLMIHIGGKFKAWRATSNGVYSSYVPEIVASAKPTIVSPRSGPIKVTAYKGIVNGKLIVLPRPVKVFEGKNNIRIVIPEGTLEEFTVEVPATEQAWADYIGVVEARYAAPAGIEDTYIDDAIENKIRGMLGLPLIVSRKAQLEKPSAQPEEPGWFHATKREYALGIIQKGFLEISLFEGYYGPALFVSAEPYTIYGFLVDESRENLGPIGFMFEIARSPDDVNYIATYKHWINTVREHWYRSYQPIPSSRIIRIYCSEDSRQYIEQNLKQLLDTQDIDIVYIPAERWEPSLIMEDIAALHGMSVEEFNKFVEKVREEWPKYVCENCKEIFDSDSKVCPNCGEKVY